MCCVYFSLGLWDHWTTIETELFRRARGAKLALGYVSHLFFCHRQCKSLRPRELNLADNSTTFIYNLIWRFLPRVKVVDSCEYNSFRHRVWLHLLSLWSLPSPLCLTVHCGPSTLPSQEFISLLGVLDLGLNPAESICKKCLHGWDF